MNEPISRLSVRAVRVWEMIIDLVPLSDPEPLLSPDPGSIAVMLVAIVSRPDCFDVLRLLSRQSETMLAASGSVGCTPRTRVGYLGRRKSRRESITDVPGREMIHFIFNWRSPRRTKLSQTRLPEPVATRVIRIERRSPVIICQRNIIHRQRLFPLGSGRALVDTSARVLPRRPSLIPILPTCLSKNESTALDTRNVLANDTLCWASKVLPVMRVRSRAQVEVLPHRRLQSRHDYPRVFV